MSNRLLCLLYLALFCVSSKTLWGLCGEPQPRTVCAEATNSKAVVVARLVHRRFIPSKTNSDLNIYSLETVQLLRGNIAREFLVHERNDSGRSGVDWKVGQQYLLFVSYSSWEHGYVVDGCSNSNFFSRSSETLDEVVAMRDSQERPLISGAVSTDGSNGLPGADRADIVASGPAGIFRTRTDPDGRFELRVDPGSYKITAKSREFTLAPGIFSYENPLHIRLEKGNCVQIQFEGGSTRL